MSCKMLPIFLDLKGKKVAVLGGGEVGHRKALFFKEEAEVVVVGRELSEKFLGSGIRTVREDITLSLDRWVDWADMVVAATDSPELNETIFRACSARGKWCNNATGPSSMLIPSVVYKEGYMVAISTLGRSPAMSKYLRRFLQEVLGPEYSAMVSVQERLRDEARDLIMDQKERERYLWGVLEDEGIWGRLRSGDMDGALSMARERMVRKD